MVKTRTWFMGTLSRISHSAGTVVDTDELGLVTISMLID